MTSAGALRIVVHGAKGRMGTRLVALARNDTRLQLVAALDLGDDEAWIASSEGADAVIDFSSDLGAQSAVRVALAKRCALLVGTTALSRTTLSMFDDAAKSIPAMVAANTSLGVAVARRLVRQAAQMLGDAFDAEIVERHHRLKKDAPSGTAKLLEESLRAGGRPLEPSRIHALRGGDVIGEHAVSFCGPGEVLEIRHAATSRDLFALGALTLVSWLVRQAPGAHSVDEWIEQRLSRTATPSP
ncbi:MAG: 4-hydroxy-tetrahydrodipicolinate reductase [Phycisphaerae bacterium]|nr:4-hydroxy-tetrahydrodipicolinate reductase [Phycisphaerae bacterium]